MKDLIIRLAEACGPSGDEGQVRALLREAVAPYADEVREDVLGNLIVSKKGNGQDRKHLLLVAHMDEPGLMVNHVEPDGFLRIVPVGGFDGKDAGYLVGRRVVFTNGVRGVVGSAHVKGIGDLSHAALFVDIGATSKEEALSRVGIGDFAALDEQVFEIAPNRLVGKALDNRAGCAAAVEVLKNLGSQKHDVTVVFTVQQGVNARGARTAAYGLQPDFALVLDAVVPGDTPGAGRLEVECGKGVSVKILDRTVVVPPRIKNFLIDQAEAANLPYQLEVHPQGSSEAGAIFVTRDGVPAGVLSIPVRYGTTGSELLDLRDVEATVKTAIGALEQYALS